MLPENEIAGYTANLALTKQFCARALKNTERHPARTLRTLGRDPEIKLEYNFQTRVIADWCGVAERVYESFQWPQDPTVDRFLIRRLFNLQISEKEEQNLTEMGHPAEVGRILVCEVDLTSVDGASEAGSLGFIDVYDLPPIDTWFHLSYKEGTRLLYVWVPEQFIQLAQEAIEVNCTELLYWK